jgi:glycosyltransferase involved in cell wall biosynthesis
VRVALVHPFHWEDVRRGGERYFGDLARYLAANGHHVEVITGTHGEARVDQDGTLVVRRVPHRLPERLKRRGVSLVDAFGAVAFKQLRGRDFDVVHAMTPTTAIASRLARQRTLLTALGHPTRDQFGVRPGDLLLARVAARAAYACAAFSDASAAQVREVLKRPALPLPLGVRSDDSPVDARPRTGPPRLLFAGFPGDPRKGIDLALRAMPAVLDVRPDARLLIPGRPEDRAHVQLELGPDTERVVAATDDLGVLPMEAMPELYRSATLSFLPSRHEALGISLVESLASGTPVVASRDGGMPSIVSSPAVGKVFPTGDVAALSSALLETIDLAAQAGTPTACATHARGWDWDDVVGPLHVRTYEGLVQDAGRGRSSQASSAETS